MKLLKQFSGHVRKTEAISGDAMGILNEIPSYVPGDKPTVPGHEVTVRVVAVGNKVKHYRVGQRWIVQADYRNLKTAGANCALGYDFEGGLQEYVLMDERVIGDPDGPEGYMIAADEENSASALALVEPWACVERAYATKERRSLKAGGRLLVVVDPGRQVGSFEAIIEGSNFAEVVRFSPQTADREPLTEIPAAHFDDIVYFGHDPETVEALDAKLAPNGVLNVVLGGKKLGRPVSLAVGRAHYGNMRWIGTTGDDPAESYRMVPETGELRAGDRLLVIGAGGPMGQMHVIRALSSGTPGLQVTASDIDDTRLRVLSEKVAPLPASTGDGFRTVNTTKEDPGSGFSYAALMAPVPALVTDGLRRCAPGARLNVFAGIPATVRHPIDMDDVIAKRIYILGTSGSEIEDMKVVYRKLADGRLDTDLSVGAISGMAGAQEGLKAVENRTMDGKIVVYPELHDLGLIPLEQLAERLPSVAALLHNGAWSKEAEAELMRTCQSGS
jgi:threonine dehydrogenase-like Zn-dependent dehydrogenase